MSDRSSWAANVFIPSLVTLLAGSIILYFVRLDLSQCQDYVANVDWFMVLMLLLLGLMRVVMRAVRFCLVLPDAISRSRMSVLFLLHQFFAGLLPLKMGEMALPMLLKREGVPWAGSLAALMMVRLMDLVALVVYLLTIMVVLRPFWPEFVQTMWPRMTVVLWGILALALVSLAARRWLLKWGDRLMEGPLGRFLPRRIWLRDRWNVFSRGVSDIPSSRMAGIVLVSLLLPVQGALTGVFLFLWLEPALDWPRVVVGEAMINLSNLIPIQGFASFGTFEGFFVMIFSNLGMTASDALALAIVSHVLVMGIVILLGLAGWGLYRRSSEG